MSTATPFKPLTKDDIAEVLGVSARTIENWVNEGTLPAPKKLGNRVYWHPKAFYHWLDVSLTDAAAISCDAAAAAPQSGIPAKPQSLTKPAKTELDKLRNRGQRKLDAIVESAAS